MAESEVVGREYLMRLVEKLSAETDRADTAEAALGEAVGLLPPADKLEALADWIDVKYPDDDDPEVQTDLRRWAHNISAFLDTHKGEG